MLFASCIVSFSVTCLSVVTNGVYRRLHLSSWRTRWSYVRSASCFKNGPLIPFLEPLKAVMKAYQALTFALQKFTSKLSRWHPKRRRHGALFLRWRAFQSCWSKSSSTMMLSSSPRSSQVYWTPSSSPMNCQLHGETMPSWPSTEQTSTTSHRLETMRTTTTCVKSCLHWIGSFSWPIRVHSS